MPALLADNNASGQLHKLLRYLQGKGWRDLWIDLGLPIETFESLGLSRNISDAVLWETCQRKKIVLITGNRNERGEESLEFALKHFNQIDSLPVFTLANPNRIMSSDVYAKRVAEKLIEKLFDLENYLGAGRIYLP